MVTESYAQSQPCIIYPWKLVNQRHVMWQNRTPQNIHRKRAIYVKTTQQLVLNLYLQADVWIKDNLNSNKINKTQNAQPSYRVHLNGQPQACFVAVGGGAEVAWLDLVLGLRPTIWPTLPRHYCPRPIDVVTRSTLIPQATAGLSLRNQPTQRGTGAVRASPACARECKNRTPRRRGRTWRTAPPAWADWQPASESEGPIHLQPRSEMLRATVPKWCSRIWLNPTWWTTWKKCNKVKIVDI